MLQAFPERCFGGEQAYDQVAAALESEHVAGVEVDVLLAEQGDGEGLVVGPGVGQ